MKSRNLIIILALSVCGTVCFSCRSQKGCRPDGWYYLNAGKTDSISKKPIITVKEFSALRLDSSVSGNKTIYQIIGQLSEEKIEKWGDATGRSVGKRIAFVYNGEVICSPQVNSRINSGAFSIGIPPYLENRYDLREIYKKLSGKVNHGKD